MLKFKPTKSSMRRANDGYGEICRLFDQYGIIRRNKQDWRLVPNSPLGQVNGISASYGRCHATDGIECLIIQGSTAYFIGHFQHFNIDESERERNETVNEKRERKYV